MFYTLLFITFSLSFMVSGLVAFIFYGSLKAIFQRIIQDSISTAWQRYIVFATFVVGISGGVRIYQLERYVTARSKEQKLLELTSERWMIEIYRTVIETLQSIAWMYLIVFIFALIAYVIVRGFEIKHREKPTQGQSKAKE